MSFLEGVLAPLIKQFTEAVLEAEIEFHLSTEIYNRKRSLTLSQVVIFF